MANTKISNLTGAASVTDASVFPVVDSGSTKKVTGTQIKTYARAGLSTVAVSGSYNDLSNKPTLFSGAYADLTGKPTLFDGNYNSLTNKPTLFSGAYADLTGKPTLFSGSYTDLTDKPIISDTTGLTGGQFFIAKDASTIQLGQWAAQAITIGSSGIQIAGTGGVEIAGVAGAGITLGGETSGTITFSSSTSGISYNDLTNTPTIPSLDGYATETYVNSAISQVNGGGASTGNITISDTNLMSTNGDVTITFDQIASPAVQFTFSSFGEFSAAQVTTSSLSTQQISMNSTKQVSNDTNISCLPNVDTVVYTGTDQWQHTFKILLKVEGNENPGQQGWDTQSCEMMIAKSYRNDAIAGSVYGLVYTSVNPLATFTTRWNPSINRVEVLCRPSSTTENVVVRSFVTEITSSD